MDHNGKSFEDGYRSFEDRFRGSRELIKQRLSVYLSLVGSIRLPSQDCAKAIDIGSGRGEWLELLADLGWRATGVEPNSIAEAASVGAEIVRTDALTYLSRCDDNCVALVTAFHVVEHLQTDYLFKLLQEIRRVLIPGGLVILETPNPENLTVGWSFYVDPTHKAPLPPVLLQYFLEQAGFPAAEIVRLNGYEGDYSFGSASAMLSMLFRSGPDYAVLGRTPTETDDLSALELRDFAITHSQHDPTDMRTLVDLAMAMDRTAANHAAQLAQLKVDQAALNQTCMELLSVYRSTSWRITKPLRLLARVLRKLAPAAQARIGSLRLRRRPLGGTGSEQASSKHDPVWSIEADPQALDAWMILTGAAAQGGQSAK